MNINAHLLQTLNHGPLKASIGDDGKVVVTVEFPTDDQGYTERACGAVDCEPKLFKIRGDIPKTEGRRCPYCGQQGDSSSFATVDQVRYAREKVEREAYAALGDVFHRTLVDGLRLDSHGRRRIGSGMFSMGLSVTRQRQVQPEVQLPKSERPRRDVKCGKCGIDHIVFGLATWCHSCGADIFDDHVRAELCDIRKLLQDCVARRQENGERLYARQAGNVLEDLVSAWEAGFRYLLQRHFLAKSKTRAETNAFIQKTIRNQLQGIERSAEVVREHLGIEVFANVDPVDVARAGKMFAARHTVTHCLGVTDEKFVTSSGSGHVGRELELDPEDLRWLAESVQGWLLGAWSGAFPKPEVGQETCGEKQP